jgi:hypothetical protein
MPGPFARSPSVARARPILLLLAFAALLVAVAVGGGCAARTLVARRLTAEASARGIDARWRSLDVRFPPAVEVRGLVAVRRAGGDTVATADSLAVALDPWSLLAFSPRLARLDVSGARVRLAARAPATEDSLEAPALGPDLPGDRTSRASAAADAIARAALFPARRLPALALRDVAIALPARDTAESRGLALAWLALRKHRGAVSVEAAGTLRLARDVPFELDLVWSPDDRLSGGARFEIPDPGRSVSAPLRLALDGRATQDHGRGVATLGEGTRLSVGPLETRIAASIARHGPAFAFAFEADSVTEEQLAGALPRPSWARSSTSPYAARSTTARGSTSISLGSTARGSRPTSSPTDCGSSPRERASGCSGSRSRSPPWCCFRVGGGLPASSRRRIRTSCRSTRWTRSS